MHSYFRFWCGQIALPSQSTHDALIRPCSHIPAPPHSTHLDFCFPCWQNALPLHFLQCVLCRLCLHILAPPQTTHSFGRLPCWHFLRTLGMVYSHGHSSGRAAALSFFCLLKRSNKARRVRTAMTLAALRPLFLVRAYTRAAARYPSGSHVRTASTASTSNPTSSTLHQTTTTPRHLAL